MNNLKDEIDYSDIKNFKKSFFYVFLDSILVWLFLIILWICIWFNFYNTSLVILFTMTIINIYSIWKQDKIYKKYQLYVNSKINEKHFLNFSQQLTDQINSPKKNNDPVKVENILIFANTQLLILITHRTYISRLTPNNRMKTFEFFGNYQFEDLIPKIQCIINFLLIKTKQEVSSMFTNELNEILTAINLHLKNLAEINEEIWQKTT